MEVEGLCLLGGWLGVKAKGIQENGLHCGKWVRELTIGDTRGEMISFIVSASANLLRAFSPSLIRLALQHVHYVHTVYALQSCVQALHCIKEA